MTTRTRSAVAALAAAVVACSAPAVGPPQDASPSPTQTPTPGPTAVDPEQEALASGLVQLGATIAAVRAGLEAGVDGAPLDDVVPLLVADPSAVVPGAPSVAPGEPVGDPPPVLPGPESSREETLRYGDLLTTLLAAARSAGGAGEPVQRLLADPVAGDLGSWQRAPDDLLALIADAAAAPTLEDAEPLVLALDGEAARALAWTALGTRVPALAPQAAERALAHLAVIEAAVQAGGSAP